MMEIVPYSLSDLSQQQKQRQNAFYSFLFQFLIVHSSLNPLNKQSSQEINHIHYANFLKDQFNTFPVAKGYPIVSRFCKQPQCFFYIQLEQAQDLQHNFFRFINRQIPNLKCKCGSVIRNPVDFVYDSALAGLLQLKLTPNQLASLGSVQITKNHEIVIPKRGVFQQAFNQARLRTIVEIGKELNQITDKEYKLRKTLKVNTYDIIHGLEDQLMHSDLFTGVKAPSEDMLVREEDRNSVVMAVCTVRENKIQAYLYKQSKDGQTFSTVALVTEHFEERILDYYDSANYTYYYLSNKGTLYACDFRSNYNFLMGHYNLCKLCSLKVFEFEQATRQYSAIIVKNNRLFLFFGKQKSAYLQIFKALIPSQSLEELQLQAILQDKVRNRRGFSVGWVKSRFFVQEECLIVYGGLVQSTRNFKLLEIIKLSQKQPERCLLYNISIAESEFQQVTLFHPTIAIFAGRLVLFGGMEMHNSQSKANQAVILVPLKKGRVVSRQITTDEVRKQQASNYTTATHVSQGWMVFLRTGRQGTSAVRLRRVANDIVQVQVIK